MSAGDALESVGERRNHAESTLERHRAGRERPLRGRGGKPVLRLTPRLWTAEEASCYESAPEPLLQEGLRDASSLLRLSGVVRRCDRCRGRDGGSLERRSSAA